MMARQKVGPSPDTVMVATASFVTWIDGKKVHVNAGVTRVLASDPVFRRMRSSFKPADADLVRSVETAEATPGERRGVSRQAAQTEAASKGTSRRKKA